MSQQVGKPSCVDPTGEQGGKTLRGQNRVHLIGVLAVAVFLVWSLLQTPFALAEDTECTGTISDAEIRANVIVPALASCTLNRITVKGNVVADGAVDVTILESTVNGNVELKETTGSILIQDSHINLSIRSITFEY